MRSLRLENARALALHAKAHQAAIRRAALANGERFLEVAVGCGHTFLPLALRNPDGENVGVDLDAAALRCCRARLDRGGARGFRLEQADARALPFAEASFDLVLCCFLLDTLDEADQDRALAELFRLLRPNGRVLLTQMARSGLSIYRLLAGEQRPVNVGPRLVAAGFRDVSQIIYKTFGFHAELVRGLKLQL
jgi:ubiquinone/menaquinone biosynthesis C-methylase UbiE